MLISILLAYCALAFVSNNVYIWFKTSTSRWINVYSPFITHTAAYDLRMEAKEHL